MLRTLSSAAHQPQHGNASEHFAPTLDVSSVLTMLRTSSSVNFTTDTSLSAFSTSSTLSLPSLFSSILCIASTDETTE